MSEIAIVPQQQTRRAYFDPTINLGAILQIAAVTVGIVMFVARGERDIALISQEVKSLRENVTDKVTRLTAATGDLRTSMAPFSNLTIRIEQADRRIAELEGVNAAQERRLNAMNEVLIMLRTRLENQPQR